MCTGKGSNGVNKECTIRRTISFSGCEERVFRIAKHEAIWRSGRANQVLELSQLEASNSGDDGQVERRQRDPTVAQQIQLLRSDGNCQYRWPDVKARLDAAEKGESDSGTTPVT